MQEVTLLHIVDSFLRKRELAIVLLLLSFLLLPGLYYGSLQNRELSRIPSF
jgi:hypothetical protein